MIEHSLDGVADLRAHVVDVAGLAHESRAMRTADGDHAAHVSACRREVVPAEPRDLSRMIQNLDDVVIREVVWRCDREGVEQTTDNVFVGAQVFPEIAPPPLINGERGE
eukprot:COSAG01_NODE_6505_length_3629_cov_6.178754_5_plen_108_part_01